MEKGERYAGIGKGIARVIPFVSAGVLLISAGFVFGLGVGVFGTWPYEPLLQAVRAVKSMAETGRIHPSGLVMARHAHAAGFRVALHRPDDMPPGYRAIMGYDDGLGLFAVWLYDGAGRLLHTWPIHYRALDPDGPSGRSDMPHGMKVLPDGSILVNFDTGDVMARLDPCGAPVWVKQGIYHHSIDRDPDGGYWTWASMGTAYGDHQALLKFDPDTGETLRTIDLVEEVARRSERSGLHLAVPVGFEARDFGRDGWMKPELQDDIFHPNDIEVLSPELAPAFPMFEPGDFLISLRNLHLVAVLDAETAEVKWARHGPWRHQHDPDFLGDGTIAVYNNNSDRPLSSIVVVDPATGDTWFKYREGEPAFYSHSMGKQQHLPGGGVQIVVPGEGRVIEVDAEGNLTFEFNNAITGDFNGHVENASWLPPDYFAVPPSCSR